MAYSYTGRVWCFFQFKFISIFLAVWVFTPRFATSAASAEETPCETALALYAPSPDEIKALGELQTHRRTLEALYVKSGRLNIKAQELPDGPEKVHLLKKAETLVGLATYFQKQHNLPNPRSKSEPEWTNRYQKLTKIEEAITRVSTIQQEYAQLLLDIRDAEHSLQATTATYVQASRWKHRQTRPTNAQRRIGLTVVTAHGDEVLPMNNFSAPVEEALRAQNLAKSTHDNLNSSRELKLAELKRAARETKELITKLAHPEDQELFTSWLSKTHPSITNLSIPNRGEPQDPAAAAARDPNMDDPEVLQILLFPKAS